VDTVTHYKAHEIPCAWLQCHGRAFQTCSSMIVIVPEHSDPAEEWLPLFEELKCSDS
jgi:hypothetical protein